jgi:hypothetical protein
VMKKRGRERRQVVRRESNRVEGSKGRRISMKMIVVMTRLRREVAARRTKKQIKATQRALLNRRKR